jgi:predicted nucleotidyltransferase
MVTSMAKTALELTREEWQGYRPAQLAENRAGAPEAAARRWQAWRVARKAARVLRRKFGATRVVVFGSLVHDVWFAAWSDIDLAAWGMPDDRFYGAVAAVAGLSPAFKVDLLDPETCGPALRAAVERDGVGL